MTLHQNGVVHATISLVKDVEHKFYNATEHDAFLKAGQATIIRDLVNERFTNVRIIIVRCEEDMVVKMVLCV